MKYKKKPVVIEAFRLGIDYIPDWFMDKVTTNEIVLLGDKNGADINTLEGVMHACYGDFIIQGVDGEIYPCKPDIFSRTYEELSYAERAAEGKRWCYDCGNYYTSYMCGYNAYYCKIHGSLDADQHERHPDHTADTCKDYVPNGKEPWYKQYED